VAAAAVAGADVLWTEDLQHGAVLEGVRVSNPFLPLEPRDREFALARGLPLAECAYPGDDH
jgi:hypothetical protein